MTVGQIRETLSATCATSNAPLDQEVSVGCASDLMSDVLAFSQSRGILLTGLTGPQSVRTAEIADIVAVCYVFGKEPPPETVRLAEKSRIPLLVTPYSLYGASGRLYQAGLPGCQADR